MKPTLAHVFALSLLALAVMLALLFYVVFDTSRATIIESAEQVRDARSREIAGDVSAFLREAPEAVAQFQAMAHRGLGDSHDPRMIGAVLCALLAAKPEIGEVALTFGTKTGYDSGGAIQLAPGSRGQVSVVRVTTAGNREKWTSRLLREADGVFIAERCEFSPDARLPEVPLVREVAPVTEDPTAHLTFVTPAREEFRGRLLWSDLHWSQLDEAVPEVRRRVEVSVQRVVEDAAGEFLGVLRVGLLARQLDRAVPFQPPPGDLHRIFLCAAEGRLITPSDRVRDSDGDLRVPPAEVPPEIASALAEPKLRDVSDETPSVAGHFVNAGQDYLSTFRRLEGTQDWIVGIVVPRAAYLGRLAAMRKRLLTLSLAISVLLVIGGGVTLRAVKAAQTQVVEQSERMRGFDFTPAPARSAFRDVGEVLEGLEQAKSAMRGMSKYVAVDLVRRLYREKIEPVLGGEDLPVSIMFTDIKDFTAFSEQLPPNELAGALGRYLDVMARVIQQETRGTIDKYIGDAIMTLWNVPEPVSEHPRMACLAALRCREAGRALSQSAEWRGLPVFETRFGLHCGEALVGHFGAHDRMNYTAIGDAINLASRLEGLNKQYGTTIIASEAIVAQTREHFTFRLLDWVAVKGKTQPVRIYELLGGLESREDRGTMAKYEEAFAAYVGHDFRGALSLLEGQLADPPSAVLAGRCRVFIDEPPPADWCGVFVSGTK